MRRRRCRGAGRDGGADFTVVPDLLAERDRARSRVAGRIGHLRQGWRSGRSASGWDVHDLTMLHIEVMEAGRRLFTASDRASCVHGELAGSGTCAPCVFGEDAFTAARARAVRDVIRYGGWGSTSAPGSSWWPAVARLCEVRVAPVAVLF